MRAKSRTSYAKASVVAGTSRVASGNASPDARNAAALATPTGGASVALLITDRQAAQLLGISRATFWRRVGDGTLPGSVKLGAASRWRRDEIFSAIQRLSDLRDAPGVDGGPL